MARVVSGCREDMNHLAANRAESVGVPEALILCRHVLRGAEVGHDVVLADMHALVGGLAEVDR